MRYIIRGYSSPYIGSDYTDALGDFASLEEANESARAYAWDNWEGGTPDDSDFEDEGPEYWIEEYDPELHDMYRAGGGSFEEDF